MAVLLLKALQYWTDNNAQTGGLSFTQRKES
jgi:hypothetical protein